MEDEAIVNLYWDRAQDAITQTDIKYGKYCHTIAWNILYNREDSEECVNDTWLRAWNSMPTHRPQLLRAFLGKITRNLALNRYEHQHTQKQGGGQTALCLEELSECISDKNRTEQVVDEMALTDCINRFLGKLKPEERKIFVRRYWCMSPVATIAQDYHLSESKVKMSLLRTREKLRTALEREGIEA